MARNKSEPVVTPASSPAETKTENPGLASTPTERFYPGKEEMISDLFKLELSYMLKNQAIDGHEPEYEKVEHVHFFRTVDSGGKTTTTSNAIGGHFHEVKWHKDLSGNVVIDSVSPAMKWVTRGAGKNKRRVMEALSHDNHEHTITYKRSHSFKAMELNKEFVKFQATQTKPAAVEGIIG